MNDEETKQDHEETLFPEALALPESERQAFLDEACAEDASLRASRSLAAA